jgi:hypothetical protein
VPPLPPGPRGDFAGRDGTARHASVGLQSGWKVARLLSWAFSYPSALMRTDAHAAARFLKARHGLKLSATYGVLRTGPNADAA